jgi:hypothetical protein
MNADKEDLKFLGPHYQARLRRVEHASPQKGLRKRAPRTRFEGDRLSAFIRGLFPLPLTYAERERFATTDERG